MQKGRPCVFQQDNAKPHTAAITTAWLRSRRVRVLNWPACSPDLSPIENIWHIIKRKIRQRLPRTLQQLETYIRQEWDQIPTPKLQKLITSMPRRHQILTGFGPPGHPQYSKSAHFRVAFYCGQPKAHLCNRQICEQYLREIGLCVHRKSLRSLSSAHEKWGQKQKCCVYIFVQCSYF